MSDILDTRDRIQETLDRGEILDIHRTRSGIRKILDITEILDTIQEI